jgi:hypothetical protein
MNRNIILSALESYRCNHITDIEGRRLLIDVLAGSNTSEEVGRELRDLADYIDGILTDLDRFRE